MEQENFQEEAVIEVSEDRLAPLKKVTPLSRYLSLALFVVLPFLGGWIGYTYAPEKVVEVERKVEITTTEEISDAVPIYQDVLRSYVARKVADAYEEHIIYNGDVVKESAEYSPDESFMLFSFKSCGDRGCDSPGGPMVYDFSHKNSYLMQFIGDDNAPYNKDASDGLMVMPQISYGTVQGWNSEGKILYKVIYKGEEFTYQSVDETKPWILGLRNSVTNSKFPASELVISEAQGTRQAGLDPFSEVFFFDGSSLQLVYKANQNCSSLNFEEVSEGTGVKYEAIDQIVSSPSAILSKTACWLDDVGYEFYLYKTESGKGVVSLPIKNPGGKGVIYWKVSGDAKVMYP